MRESIGSILWGPKMSGQNFNLFYSCLNIVMRIKLVDWQANVTNNSRGYIYVSLLVFSDLRSHFREDSVFIPDRTGCESYASITKDDLKDNCGSGHLWLYLHKVSKCHGHTNTPLSYSSILPKTTDCAAYCICGEHWPLSVPTVQWVTFRPHLTSRLGVVRCERSPLGPHPAVTAHPVKWSETPEKRRCDRPLLKLTPSKPHLLMLHFSFY